MSSLSLALSSFFFFVVVFVFGVVEEKGELLLEDEWEGFTAC